MVTAPDEPTFIEYTVGASSSGPFTFGYPYFRKSDLEVRIDGVALAQSGFTDTPGTGSATAGYDGGSITLVTPVASVTLTIARNQIAERTSDFTSGQVTGANINAALNKHAMYAQEYRRDAARSVKFPVEEDADFVMADATTRAGRFYGFDSSGAMVLYANDSTSAAVSDIVDVTPTDGTFLVGDGTTWVGESGATLQASIGLNALSDAVFRIADDGDVTKKLAFQLSGVTSGTTRTMTIPDYDGALATLAGTETLTNKAIDSASNTLTLDMSEGTLAGTLDEFNAALSDGSFATLAGTEAFTNKTFDLASNTVTGTEAQFNTALSDGDFAMRVGNQYTIAQLKALSTAGLTDGDTAYVGQALQSGYFYWDSADLSAHITAQTISATVYEGVIIAPDSDATGASGCWRRENSAANAVNVLHFGVSRTGGDSTAALQAAAQYAIYTLAPLYFPTGTYLASATIATITISDMRVYGDGETQTIVRGSHDGDLFKIDTSSAQLYRAHFEGIWFDNTHATGANAVAIRVVASAASATGLGHSMFRNLRFRKWGLANIYHEETGRIDDGLGNTTISAGGFNNYINLVTPISTRYPTNCIFWEAGNGAHNLIMGGQYRATEYGFRFGNGSADIGVGDFVCTGVHFVLGLAGFKIEGPSNDEYRSSVCVTGCQFDVVSAYTFVIDRLERVSIFGNNSKIGTAASITNCDLTRSIVQTKDALYLHSAECTYTASQTSTVETIGGTASTNGSVGPNGPATDINFSVNAKGAGYVSAPGNKANNVQFLGSTGGGTPQVRAQGTGATDLNLTIAGQGAGHIYTPAQRTNHLEFQGANTTGAVKISSYGSDTNITMDVLPKGAGSLRLGWTNNPVGFMGSNGATRQTVTGSRGGNAALASALTALEAYGLITDNTTA